MTSDQVLQQLIALVRSGLKRDENGKKQIDEIIHPLLASFVGNRTLERRQLARLLGDTEPDPKLNARISFVQNYLMGIPC